MRTTAVSLDIQPVSVDLKPPAWRRDAWRITADRVSTVSLRQVRLGPLVAEGDGEAELGFTHQFRGGSTAIFPSHVLMPKARVHYRQLGLLHDSRLDVHFAFDPYHGMLAPGGHLQWNAPMAISDADGNQQQRRGQLDLAVQADAVMIDARIPLPAGSGSATAPNQLKAHLQSAGRHVFPRHSASEVLRRLSGSVEGCWHFASLSWLTPLAMSTPWLQLGGAGDILGAVQIDAGRLAPGTRVDVPQVAQVANILDNVFAGSAHAQVRVVASGTPLDEVPDITLPELKARLAGPGAQVSVAALWRFCHRHKLTRKKRPRMPQSRTARMS